MTFCFISCFVLETIWFHASKYVYSYLAQRKLCCSNYRNDVTLYGIVEIKKKTFSNINILKVHANVLRKQCISACHAI